jgi:predicted phage terminase large subunit-like protein
MPPRHSKTLLSSVAWPAWLWTKERDERYPLIGPQAKLLCLSYGDDLALDSALLMRRLVESDWYQERWGSRVKIATDQEAKSKFDTRAGGTRISASFGGTLTGRGGDIKIIDDPLKADAAESEVERDKVIRRYDGTLKSRVTDPRHTAEVVIMQRLHENDLAGHILAEKDPDLVHLNLPALYEPHRSVVTSIGWKDPRKNDGDILWPERFGEKELAVFKRNAYEWSGQWQQRPEVRGGAIIKREWWQKWEGNWPKPDFTLAALDTAYTEKDQNDPSALTVWRSYKDANGYPKIVLCAAWQKRLPIIGETMPRRPGETDKEYRERTHPHWGLVEWVADTCNALNVDRLIIESKAAGISVAQTIKRLYKTKSWGVVMVDPKGRDKEARAHAVTDLFADKMIYAPDREWAQMVIDQAAQFPKAAHDDLVDTTLYALEHLRSIGFAIRADDFERELNEPPPKPLPTLYEV